MKKIYSTFCRLEEVIASIFLSIVTLMVFLSAVARTIKYPINWAQDVALLLFAWVVFLGADVALREADFVSVDMFVAKLPKKLQNILYFLWYFIILVFLGILIRYGVPLSLENSKRLFQTLGISYSWATMSVPVCSAFMMLTIILKLLNKIKRRKQVDS
ncbi:TRAP transporter small permease [Alkaliphilus peptidifermentans]|uniref:TRAP-type C4-dicarboxylate transport system, small permease component n=1 Tax=Alkaliphilus peptidifermentans DSM 18978 TaxID=1120976 RepID=A0A1G5L519_9FIRM|nr:TRAP transporter small permease [Alkaliphilus peptidifermentans]SCZ07957.1 TRAP-type C4-dicarboxylate transport system, small permease component [Alkaliphilus peptidifermentans DSM 18978]